MKKLNKTRKNVRKKKSAVLKLKKYVINLRKKSFKYYKNIKKYIKKSLKPFLKQIKSFYKKSKKRLKPTFLYIKKRRMFFIIVSVVSMLLLITQLFYYATNSNNNKNMLSIENKFKEILISYNISYDKKYIKNKEVLLIGRVDYKYSFNNIKKDIINNFYRYKIISENKLYLQMKLFDKNKNIILTVILIKKNPKYKIAIVIDDVGYDLDKLKMFLNLDIPLTFAVMPRELYSKESVDLINKKNYSYILHQPMEPFDYPETNPGMFALLKDYSKNEIKKIVLNNLKSLNMPKGINNHMGSAFTSDTKLMRVFLDIVKYNNMFYLNSMTARSKVSKKICKELNIPYLESSFFLDAREDIDFIRGRLNLSMKYARKKKQVVVIGHVYVDNLYTVLKELKNEFKKNEIEFVFLKDLINYEDISNRNIV